MNCDLPNPAKCRQVAKPTLVVGPAALPAGWLDPRFGGRDPTSARPDITTPARRHL